MSRIILGPLVIFVLLASNAAVSATFFTAKSGSDGNSCVQAQSEATPKLTIQAGIGCLSSGDTLVVKAGTYAEVSMIGNNIPNGTSWSNVTTLKSADGDVVTIRTPTGASQYRALFFGGSQTANIKQYIEVDGFIFDATGGNDVAAKIEGPSHHIRLQNNVFANAKNTAFLVVNPRGWTESVGGHEFINNTFRDSGESALDHGIYLQHDNCKLWNNTAENNSGFGFHVYHEYGLVNNSDIQYNVAFDNAKFGIVVDGSNNLIANNVFYRNSGGGIRIWDGSSNKYFNNTVTEYSGGIGLSIRSAATNNSIRNNIFWGTGTDISDSGTGNAILTNLTANPSFVSPATNDYRLQPTSPAIDSGANVAEVTDDIDGVPRPQGAGMDAGAFEYSELTQSGPAAPLPPRLVGAN